MSITEFSYLDTSRNIFTDKVTEFTYLDTSRYIYTDKTIEFIYLDTSRNVIQGKVTEFSYLDTKRNVFTDKATEFNYLDTRRFIYLDTINESGYLDTSREVEAKRVNEYLHLDTSRRIYNVFAKNTINLWGLRDFESDYAIENISISLDAGQISEKYSATLRSKVNINENFSCKIGDFDCSFKVLDIKHALTGGYQITARQDLDNWMFESVAFSFLPVAAHSANSYINQQVTTYTTMPFASTVMQALGVQGIYDDFTASTINLQANKHIVGNQIIDTTPEKNTNTNPYRDGGQDVNIWGMTSHQTKKQILTSLFGWASSLPRMKHIITFRNGIPYVYQRNLLPTVSNLDDRSKWTIDKKEENSELIRTLYGNSLFSVVKNQADSTEDYNIPDITQLYTGTVSFGNCSLYYQNGLLKQKTENGKTTYYYYTMLDDSSTTTDTVEMNLIFGHTNIGLSKEVTSDRVTQYFYNIYNKINYLSSKIEYNPSSSEMKGRQETIYVPLHSGFWGYSVQVHDGEKWVTKNSGIMESPASGQASLYRVKSTILSITHNNGGSQIVTDSTVQLAGQPTGDIPTAPDYAMAQKIANEINWMNGKIHRTITLEAFNLQNNNHLIDVTEKVTFENKEWYVVSNTVNIQSNRVSQTLTLERWE